MSRRRVLGFLLALSLAGCGGDGDELDLVAGSAGPRAIPGCDFDYRPCDVRETACQLVKLSITACVRGDAPGKLPAFSVMTAEEFSAYAGSESPRPDPDHWEEAYVMLGLVEPGGLRTKRKPPRSSHDVAAFYRWAEKDIVFIDRGEPFDGLDANGTLVHEFVHLLQDREVDLEAYAEAHYVNDDVYTAAKSVPEGEATLLAGRVRAAMLGLDVEAVDWETRLDEIAGYWEDWVFEQPSPLVAANEVLPYSFGARYLYPRFRDEGHAAVLDLFENPPTSSKALMLGHATDSESSRFPAVTPPTGIEHFSTSNLGAFGLFLVLDQGPTWRDRARELALTWRSDELAIYVESETESPIVVWSVDASEEALDVLEQRLQALLPHVALRREGERLRAAAGKSASADASWAVEGEL